MKDIISSFTVLLIACGWLHLSGIAEMPDIAAKCVMLTIYAHLALGVVYIVRFAVSRPKTKVVKKVAVQRDIAREEIEHHLSPVTD